MRATHFILIVATALSVGARAQPSDSYSALVEQSGTVVCGENPTESCELSCVAWAKAGKDGYLVFGNDKLPKSPKEASVFSIPYTGGEFKENGPRSYYSFPPFSRAMKFESMSVTPDGSYLVAMTGLDRYEERDPELDRFNLMIAWPAAAPDKAKVVSSSKRNEIESSRTLRQRLAKTIQKKLGDRTIYFKVEGMALLPENRILFGVREAGLNYTTFEYQVMLIEGRYTIRDGEFSLDEQTDFEIVRDFNEATRSLGQKLGLSSIEYDNVNKQLYLLTTFEENEGTRIGAYLWVIPDENGKLGTSPKLVRTSDGAPFLFPHKAEGMTVVDGGRVFIVHDDDRNATNVRIGGRNGGQLRARKLNEAAFDVVRICSARDAAACSVAR